MTKNPYTINFGKIPTQYISRNIIIDSIVEEITEDPIQTQGFKLTGLRGSGKTVTLTAIENRLREIGNWIIIDLSPDSDIFTDLLAALYNSHPDITKYISSELDLSKYGIGLKISSKPPVESVDYALKKILTEVKRQGKKVLISIDEMRKTDGIVRFVQEFQILVRNDLPIFLIAAGLYEDIENVENSDGMTFFLRAAKYDMSPLSQTRMAEDYKKTLMISENAAIELAAISKGYAFAYQALGKYMWDTKADKVNSEVLQLFDDTIAEKVYNKIWSELRPGDKKYLKVIAEKETISAVELLEITHKSHSEWSGARKRLSEKGIIDTKTRGITKSKLPRLFEYIREYHQDED